MDVEDAHKLKILSTAETKEILMNFWDNDADFFSNAKKIFDTVTDTNEQISFLRAMLINKLIGECIAVFMAHYDAIMNGSHNSSLIDSLEGVSAEAMKNCRKLSFLRIYNHPAVVEVELAGYRILGALLDEFVDAALNPESEYAKKMLALLPEQFTCPPDASTYARIFSILDFVSGMTDLYALDLYRKIYGINLL